MKIGIYYDTLLGMGGAEKNVVQLANALGAEIVTSGYAPEKLIIKPEYPVHDIGNVTARWSKAVGYIFEAPFRFFFNKNKFAFDVEIYVGYTSIYGAKKHTNNIWYCLTPNRILYDLRKQKLANQSLPGKLALHLHILLFGQWDKRCVKKIRLIVSQTEVVRKRVKKYYNRDSSVVYAAVDTKGYKSSARGYYFLAVSRLFPEKRISLIAQSFVGLTSKLILVGEGPEKLKISKLIANNDNIKLLSNVPEVELKELYKNCRATIYMPIEEDYGYVPIEGMAAGKPCIAANEGGCRETILHGKTGFLIKADVKSIRACVNVITNEWASEHADLCRKQALRFSLDPIIAEWGKIIAGSLSR